MSEIHKTMLHVKPEKLCFHLTKESRLKFPPLVKMVTDVERRHLWREKKPGKFLVFFFSYPHVKTLQGNMPAGVVTFGAMRTQYVAK